MRLTNDMRDTFVEAVMRDIPNKENPGEEARKLVQAAYIEKLPKSVRAVYENAETRGFLKTARPDNQPRSAWWSLYGGDIVPYDQLPAALRSKVEKLLAKASEQEKQRTEMRRRVRTAAYACTTRKQLVERFPEFEKWVPGAPVSATENLPADASLVADLVKLGWPNGKKLEDRK